MTAEKLYRKLESGHMTSVIIEGAKGEILESIIYIYRPFEPEDKQISIRFQSKVSG